MKRGAKKSKTSRDIQRVQQVREMPKAKAEPEDHNKTGRDEDKQYKLLSFRLKRRKEKS